MCIGRIAEIIIPDTKFSRQTEGYVTLDRFLIAKELHPVSNLPFLRRPDPTLAQQQVVKTQVGLTGKFR